MSESLEKEPSAAADRRWFTTTHWSVVLSARNRQSPQSERALAALCETYWFPLYAYVRRSGYQPRPVLPSDEEPLATKSR